MEILRFFLANFIILITAGNNVVLFDKYIYKKDSNIRKHLIFSLLFSISLSALNSGIQYLDSDTIKVVLKILIYVIPFMLILKLLESKFWKAVFIFCIALTSMAIGESIVLSLFMAFGRNLEEIASGDNLLLYFVGNVFINVFQLLILQIFRAKKSIGLLAKGLKSTTYKNIAINMISAIAVMILTIYMIGFSIDKTKHIVIVAYGSITLLTLICNIFAVRMVIQTDFRDEKLKMQEEYNEILVDLKHKFFGIMSILNALVDEGNIDKLREYINEINEGFITRIKNMPTNIKNNKLFYLIAMKSGEAHDKGIALRVAIPYEITDIKGINEDDYVYIVNELISNAIEHSEEATDREVFIKIENFQDRMVTIIENSIANKKDGLGELKVKNTARGKGLKQISKMLNDNCYFKISLSNKFRAELIIYK